MFKRRKSIVYLSASLVAIQSAGAAHAQAGVAAPPHTAQAADPGEQSPPPENGDIVVTALRRSERLQSVPASISAIGGDALASAHIASSAELSTSVPNLQATSTLGENVPIFSLRGVSMSDFSVNQQSPVATYFDEVYKGSFPFIPVGLYDLERVEVLRGPQGTLYGKNTTGGAVNFISRVPQFRNEGYLSLGYGNYNRFDANGAVNLGISDKTAARVAFTFARNDGWYKNQVPGEPDLNQVRNYAVRASLRTQPADGIELILRASTSLDNPYNYGIYGRPLASGIGAGVYELFGGQSYFRQGLAKREIETSYARRRRHRTNSISLTGTWDFADELTLTSITSYDRGNLHNPEDTEGSPRQVNDSDIRARGHQFAQDIRVSSAFDGGLNFILGAYYNFEKLRTGTEYRFYTDIDVDGNGSINAADCAVDLFTACAYRNSFVQTKRTVALYSDFNYDLSDRLTFRGGLRYTWDSGDLRDFNATAFGIDGIAVANAIPGDPLNSAATTGLDFDKGSFTGKAGIDFKINSDQLVYASYSRGYRGSSFNSQAFFAPSELTVAKPETVDAYEVGAKTQFLNRKLTVNGAAFYYDYSNQQALSLIGVLQPLVNIPKSRIYGGEVEVIGRPSADVTVRLNAGYLQTKIKEGLLSGRSLAGNKLPNAPTWSLSGSVDWTVLRSSAGKLDVGVSSNYNSKQYFELFNVERIARKPYALVNAQMTYTLPNDKLQIQIWSKNLSNKTFFTSGLDLSTLGYDYFHLNDPRTYGVTLTARM